MNEFQEALNELFEAGKEITKINKKSDREQVLYFYKKEDNYVVDLVVQLRNNEKIDKNIYKIIKKLDKYDFKFVIEELSINQLANYLKMYRKEKLLSMKEYDKIFKISYLIQENILLDSFESNFETKYGIPIYYFYFLNQKVDIPYRELELISDISKDTINNYVNIYKIFLKEQKKLKNLRQMVSEQENKCFEYKKKL